uniref:Uncharacterized protein n=1 Tax=Hordeum vulgare subsp. vulgare TaxID=112509 RepID=A0A8I6XPI7_HORVV
MSLEHVHTVGGTWLAQASPSSHASPAASATARPRSPPPSRGRCPTRSWRGASGTGTSPGAPWASTRRSDAGVAVAAAKAWARRPPPAAAAAWPRSPAAEAAAPDGTCSGDG